MRNPLETMICIKKRERTTAIVCLCLLAWFVMPAYSQRPATTPSGIFVIAPSSGDFGSIAVGQTSPAISFVLTNETTSTIAYLGLTNLGEFFVQPGTCHLVSGELMLNPAQSCVLNAVFQPTAAGPVSETLQIRTSSGTFDLPISGTGAALLIAPSRAAFGTVVLGTTSPAVSFTVTNYTTTAATYVNRRGSSSFKVQPGTCRLDESDAMLAAGASCVFTVRYAPTASGAATGSLDISTNLGPVVLPMSGTGSSPGSSKLAIAPSSGNFGSIAVGKVSPAISFTLSNGTPSKMEYLGYTNLGEFYLQPGTCRLVTGELMLNPGQSCTLTAIFQPTAAGPVSGTLSIQTSSGIFDLPMNGTGAALVIGPSRAAFGSVPLGTTSPTLSFTATNYTTEPVTYVNRRGSSSFTVQPGTCRMDDTDVMLAAGASCVFTVQYAPTVSAAATGSLQLSTNLGPVVFPMDGTGVGTTYSESVLYSFCSAANCADGSAPSAGLIQDAAGNLYGTTASGGSSRYSAGTVFKLDNTGHETVLHRFCSAANCADGDRPESGLIEDAAGNLYGTTTYGGAKNRGTVFKVDNTGVETVLYSFCSAANCADGAYPLAGLIQDPAGDFYGTTFNGGSSDRGTVFKLGNTGVETVLYSFCSAFDCVDGSWPFAGLIQDAAGNLYGTTRTGGYNLRAEGTVFKVDSTGRETVLYNFCSAALCEDGSTPFGNLIQDAAGNLFGTTGDGGSPCLTGSCGTLFKIDKMGHETVLYSFCSAANCADGSAPRGGLIQDTAGNLFGTTYGGGAADPALCPRFGCGTVFRIDITGHERVLYSFCTAANCADGSDPEGGLIQDAAGNLFGTTSGGGLNGGVTAGGTVFKLTPHSN